MDSGNTRTRTSYDAEDDSVTSRDISVKGADGNYSTISTETYSYYDKYDTGKIKDAVSQIAFGENANLSYKYYANGNIKEEYKNGTLYKKYTYDALGQLTEAYFYDLDVINGILGEFGDEVAASGDHIKFTYSYSSGNNMTAYTITLCRADSSEISIKNKVMHYGETNWADQLSTYYPETYEFSRLYDPVGNPLFDENYEYTWENARELVSIKSKATNATVASYEYDSSGLRISKTTPTETVYYAYDENANLIFEKHDSFTLAFHYDGNGIRTHFDHITSSATNTYYYRYNLQGDVIALLNSAGTVVANYEYTPYGKEVYTPNAIGSLNPFRYKGYYFDSETSYYYLQSRYYDPEICRFINADDPAFLGVTGTLLSYNLYTYCENDPVNSMDESGNFTIKIYAIAAVTAAVISAVAKIVGNYAKGYRGSKLFRGVLGASIGSAVNVVLLMKLIKWGTKGMALAAFASAAVQAVFDFAEGVLIDKKYKWKQLTYDFILNYASTFVGNYIGGKAIFINGSWFQPRKLGSFFTKAYGKKLIAQTGIGAVLSLIIDLTRTGLEKLSIKK